jgi:hypothetical protein
MNSESNQLISIAIGTIARAAGGGSAVDFIETNPNRVRKLELRFRTGNDWKTILTGTILGNDHQKSLTSAAASKFGLNFYNATSGPAITGVEPQSR